MSFRRNGGVPGRKRVENHPLYQKFKRDIYSIMPGDIIQSQYIGGGKRCVWWRRGDRLRLCWWWLRPWCTVVNRALWVSRQDPKYFKAIMDYRRATKV